MSVPDLDRKDLAREYLRAAREDHKRASRNRIYYARLARREGLTNQQIGMQLGITEASVRGLLRRASRAEGEGNA